MDSDSPVTRKFFSFLRTLSRAAQRGLLSVSKIRWNFILRSAALHPALGKACTLSKNEPTLNQRKLLGYEFQCLKYVRRGLLKGSETVIRIYFLKLKAEPLSVSAAFYF